MSPADFDFEVYAAYEAELQKRCRNFVAADSGILVYRRMRVASVFSAGCRDMEMSLRWQLGGLAASMDYEADIPNFLEPWYGIGTAAAAFGLDYIWGEGQAPAIYPTFNSVQDALDCATIPIKNTECGRHTLEMTEYFMEKTNGRVPISLSDIQSPLNVICNMIDSTAVYLAMLDAPDQVSALLDKVAGLILDFASEQQRVLGETVAWPGHGFPSVRSFSSVGVSDDNIIMLSSELYSEIAAPSFNRVCQSFGGASFHSCGNWADKIKAVKKLDHLFMVDGAFSPATDPAPNVPELFGRAFSGTGVILNARIVGSADDVVNVVERLWTPGLKLIVTTYCETPDEQAECYERIKKIIKDRSVEISFAD